MTSPIHSTEDIGRAVRAARHERGLSQEALALASGTGRRFVVNLEQGKPTVRLQSLLDVLAALDLRIEIAPDRDQPRARP
jgi:HTH-type transcriptional regulator/antitoxin HipB